MWWSQLRSALHSWPGSCRWRRNQGGPGWTQKPKSFVRDLHRKNLAFRKQWHWDHWDSIIILLIWQPLGFNCSSIYETIIINIPPECRMQGDHCYDLGKGLCKRCTTPAVCPRPGPRECKPFFHFISNSCWSCEGWSSQLILIPYLCILDSISPYNNIPTVVLNFWEGMGGYDVSKRDMYIDYRYTKKIFEMRWDEMER